MKRTLTFALVFTLGLAVGAFAAKKGIDSSLFVGKEPKVAADALLEVAKTQAGKGSWERIAVGRVLYLSNRKAEGQTIFDEVTAKKPEGSDWLRIGRIYLEAGEWDKAKGAFDKALAASPKDAPWMAEIGGHYNMKGDRARAEEYFAKSFSLESDEFWSTINVAGSYVGVKPQ
ncbi:MAG: tetratricopeptide repeat protein [Thermoanaerobaculia bacterium]|nr:tetratricopeptide repeat protein [Thermoanaerobaculia bacterium]